jgi:hypothetical protein
MTSPIQAFGKGLAEGGSAIQGRPSFGEVAAPVAPPPLPMANTPTQRAPRKSQQQSFLSGVAASVGAGAGGAGNTGKTLLGA